MSNEVCQRLDDLINIAIAPLVTKSRELYHLAADVYKGGHFEDALEYLNKSLLEYKSDYISWFLMGKIYTNFIKNMSFRIDISAIILSPSIIWAIIPGAISLTFGIINLLLIRKKRYTVLLPEGVLILAIIILVTAVTISNWMRFVFIFTPTVKNSIIMLVPSIPGIIMIYLAKK